MSGYTCNFCSRNYKEKFNYERHYSFCEFINKSNREQNNVLETADTLPTQLQMYRWMQELAVRVTKLEKENAKLKQVQRQKIDIVNWLNQSIKPDITFHEWIIQYVFKMIPDVLDIVYKNNLLTGFNHLFEKAFNKITMEKSPIRAFDNKPNTFYIYSKVLSETNQENKENQWTMILNSDFDKYLNQIANHFIVQFRNCWFLVNEEKIETEEAYKDMYVNYYQKILGGDCKMTDEVRYQRVRQTFYNHIKQNIKQIVEYDFA